MKKILTTSFLIKIASSILTLFVVIFAYSYGKSLIAQMNFENLDLHPVYLILGFVVFSCFYALMALHWLWTCRLIDPKVRSEQAVAYVASQPYKYLPTSAFTFSFRAKYARDLGLSLKQSSYAQLIENGSIVSSGLLVAIVFYCFTRKALYGYIIFGLLMAAAYIVAKKKIKIVVPKYNRVLPLYKLVPNFVLLLVAWIVAGISFTLVNMTFGITVDFFVFTTANAASNVASILAFFAPGGIGVREATLGFFGIIAPVVVVWRLLTFVADIVFGTSGIFYVKLMK